MNRYEFVVQYRVISEKKAPEEVEDIAKKIEKKKPDDTHNEILTFPETERVSISKNKK